MQNDENEKQEIKYFGDSDHDYTVNIEISQSAGQSINQPMSASQLVFHSFGQ